MYTLSPLLRSLRTIFLALTLALFVIGAISTASATSISTASATSNKVILDAKVLSYNQLPAIERDELTKYECCPYNKSIEATPVGGHFNAEDAYFVQTTIDPSALAQILLLNSCEGESWWRRCSPERLKEKVQELFNYSNPHMFYGKYMNRWVFSNENGDIPSTAKFTGHDILALTQSGTPVQHNLTIGSLTQKPSLMKIQPYNSLEKDDKSSAALEVNFAAS